MRGAHQHVARDATKMQGESAGAVLDRVWDALALAGFVVRGRYGAALVYLAEAVRSERSARRPE